MSANTAEAHHRSAIKLLGRGELDAAATAFRRAVALKPNWTEAHYNLGVALRDQGMPEEAAAAFRCALGLKPGFIQAHNNLGTTLLGLGQPEEAAICFRFVLTLQPDQAKPQNNLGIALLDQGKLDEAVAAFERAIALDPNYAKAHYNLGVALQYQGKLGLASTAFRRALDLKPDYAEAHYNLANQGLMNGASPEAEVGFARLSRQADAVDRFQSKDREALLFAMSKALEGRGEFDRAFSYMARANALHRAGLSFDIAKLEQRMASIAELFDIPLLHRLRNVGVASERPVFIVGMPRSGTTLVEQIISAHPRAHGAGELANMAKLIAEGQGDGSAFPLWARTMTVADCQRLGQTYLHSLPAGKPGETRVTDKSMSNIEHLGLIHLCLPHARIILCERDPRDICVSCFATRFSNGLAYAYDLAELGRYWRAYDQLTAYWRAALPPESMLVVPYEALVEDTEAWARRMIAHCDLGWDDACLRFYESGREVRTASFAQVRQPIYTSSVGRWRRFARHLDPLFEALGGC